MLLEICRFHRLIALPGSTRIRGRDPIDFSAIVQARDLRPGIDQSERQEPDVCDETLAAFERLVRERG
jgi:hypothetical protein